MSKTPPWTVDSDVPIPRISAYNLVDFLIHVRNRAGEKWCPLIIECDGHDYHERTKLQAARDRSKDRNATLLGYEFFRFTGSEIWRDPWGCAEQISSWAAAKAT